MQTLKKTIKRTLGNEYLCITSIYEISYFAVARKFEDDEYLIQSKAEELYAKKNTTITHYTKIEDVENIEKYKVGKPVFMSGKVYKQINKTEFVESTAEDSIDCICSTKIEGVWKEYVGIISSIDLQNNCITFASHGDYLFYVDNSDLYQIGDVVLFDGRILDEDYALTLKIQQSIVGKVTAKINEHYLAIFKD